MPTTPERVPWPPQADDLRRAIRGLAQLGAFSRQTTEDVLIAATIWLLTSQEKALPNPGCGCAGCLLAQALLEWWPEIHEDISPQWRPIGTAPTPSPN